MIAVYTSGTNALLFDQIIDNNYVAEFYNQDTLYHDTVAHEYLLTDSTGKRFVFTDHTANWPRGQQGTTVFFSYFSPQ